MTAQIDDGRQNIAKNKVNTAHTYKHSQKKMYICCYAT